MPQTEIFFFRELKGNPVPVLEIDVALTRKKHVECDFARFNFQPE